MLRKKYLKNLSLLLLSSSLVACGGLRDDIVVKTEYVRPQISIQPRPDAVNLYDVQFYAVNESNLDEFLERFQRENGDVVFFAISVVDYENMSLNLSELKRYIQQQKSLIVYYEKSLRELPTPDAKEEVVQQGTFSSWKNIFRKGDSNVNGRSTELKAGQN